MNSTGNTRRTGRTVTTLASLTTAAALTGGLGVALFAAPATASDDDGRVERSGTCSGGGQWKLKAKHDDGGIEWEFEVDTNRNGQVWNVRVTDNGALVMSGPRTTRAPSGSFSVERTTTDRKGTDTIVAVARRASGAAVCRGSVTV